MCRQEAQLCVAKGSAGSLSEMSSRAMYTPRNSFGELVPFMEVVGIYGEVAGSLGQGLCGCVPLARAEVLEDTSSTHSRALVAAGDGGWGMLIRSKNEA